MSMLDAKDNETRSYLEFVDILRQHGAAPKEDMHALWRRIVFSILISNTDDHLRNHGFLWAGPAGWRLSPAYDLNPVPTDIKPRVLTTAIDLTTAQPRSTWRSTSPGISNSLQAKRARSPVRSGKLSLRGAR